MPPFRKVLVVDDDPLQLEVIRDYFTRLNVTDIVCVTDSQIALSLLCAPPDDQPDLIVSDIHMPIVDGIEILNFLSQENNKTPLILISGSTHDQLRSASILAKSYGLNIYGALEKPLSLNELDDALERVHA